MDTDKNKTTTIPELSTDQKIDLLLTKVSDIGKSLTTLANRITEVEKTATTQATALTVIDKKVSADSIRIQELEDAQAEQSKMLKEVQQIAEFISQEFEKSKTKIAQIDGLKTENVFLKKRIDDMCNDLEQEKIARNDSEQYLRTTYNIKLCGVPAVPGEDFQTSSATNPVTLAVLKTVCQQLDVLLPPSAVDVCHRLSNDATSPIIIRFNSKSDRYNFFAQRSKFKNINSDKIDLNGIQIPPHMKAEMEQRRPARGKRGGRRGGYNNVGTRAAKEGPTPIFLQDHLTKRKKDVIKSSRDILALARGEEPR